MKRRVLFVSLALALTSSAASAEEVIPLSPSSTAVSVGLEHLQGATLRVAFGPGDRASPTSTTLQRATAAGPTVAARLDATAGIVGVELGAQAGQALGETFFVREAIAVGPVVGAVPVGVGVAGGASVALGACLGDVVVVAGPRVFGTALVVGPVPGRVVVDGVAGVAIPVAAVGDVGFAVTGLVSAGLEVPHVGGVLSKQSAVAGSAVIGLQLRL